MKNGKAEVIDLKLFDGGNIKVKLKSHEDLDRFIKITKELAAVGTIFESLSDTEVLCKVPKP